MPPLPADSIHARACKLKCEKILTRPAAPSQDVHGEYVLCGHSQGRVLFTAGIQDVSPEGI